MANASVSDVLREAAEYLCKLGNNLKIRSENLKDKRLGKDKLKNSISVSKAADKMLVICQLSRQSLDNVESSVKKIIQVCSSDSDRAKDIHCRDHRDSDSKLSSSKNSVKSEYDKKFQYHIVGSKKIKIPRKIPLKHFLSCKIKTDMMSIKKMLKYPVYHHCNLLRLKRKLKHQKRRRSREQRECDSELHKKQKKSDSDNSFKNDANDESINTVQASITEVNNKDNQHCEIDDSSKKFFRSEYETVKTQESTEIVSQCMESVQTEYANNSDKCTESVHTKNANNSLKADSEIEGKIEGKSQNESNNEMDIKENESEKKTYVKERDVSLLGNGKNTKNETIVTLSDSEDEAKMTPRPEEGIIVNTNPHQIKPILKCVNINQLINPDLVPNVTTNTTKPKLKPSWKIQFKPKKDKDNTNKNASKANVKRVSFKTDEDDYWEKKRKEVKAFKSKKFHIYIKHYHFDRDFMMKYNIKKIIRAGKTIFELENISTVACEGANKDKDICNYENNEKQIVSIVDNDTVSKKHDKTKNNEPERKEIISESDKSPSNSLNNSESESSQSQMSKKSQLTTKKTKSMWDSDDSPPNSPDKSINNLDYNTEESNTKLINVFTNDEKSPSALNCNKSNPDKDLDKGNSLLTSSPDKSKGISEKSLDIECEKTIDESYISNKNTRKGPEVLKSKKNKKSLLRDSDSDDSTIEDPVNKHNDSCENENDQNNHTSPDVLGAKTEREEVKKALLNDSDSDQSKDSNNKEIIGKTDDNDLKDNENIRKSLLNDSDSGDGTNKKSHDSSHIKYGNKSSLLKQNDSEQNVCKRQLESPTPSPNSKRKCIDAKNMLLAHVSSSDNEDKSENVDEKKVCSSKSSSSEITSPRKLARSSDEESSDDNIAKRKKFRKKMKKSKKHRKKVVDSDSSISQTGENMDSKVKHGNRKMGRSKASGSSDPESQDKDIDGLINLKTLVKRKSRYNSTSSNDTERSNNIPKLKIKRSAIVQQEDILKAESESSAGESDEVDHEVEELPMVSMSELNGSGPIDKLSKDGLLDDTDSLSSDKEETPKEDSDSENPKQKRRKGVIMSDSEDGSSKKKEDPDSDFEEDSDSSAPKKKRKKPVSGSDDGSSEDTGKKKRRRIKKVDDSDDSGSESETEGKKHGRKNIRKVMGKDQLEEATKKAAREEKERVARIADRQRMYNNLAFDESGKPDEVVLDKVVLDFDPDTKEPLIEVDRGLVKKLKPHQANGIKFMWDACFESVKRIKKHKGSGCILAHCMGLGKTLQVVSLTHTLLSHSKLTGVHRVLVVCPLSTVLNWVNEYRMWLKHAHNDTDIDIYELSRHKQNSERAYQLQEWLTQGGICVLGYEMFRNLSADNPKKFRKKMLKSFQESLVNPGPDLVVCDEGHLLKNEKTSLSQSMNRVRTLRRIVLTGTPLQNNLKEYYCMVQFVKPNLLGKYNEYLNRFVNPITNGQYTDSTEQDIRVMKRRSHVLHKMLDGAVQRRDYGVLAPFLPPKHEYVLFITITDVQAKLYQHYLDNYSRRPLAGKSSGFLFPDFQSLQRIWTHPLVLKYNSERYEIMQQKKREREEDSEGSLVDFIDDESTSEESSSEESSDSMSDMSDDSRKKSKKKAKEKKVKKEKNKDKDAKSTRRGTRANPGEPTDEITLSDVEEKNDNPTEWWIPLVSDDEIEDLRNSHKLLLLFHILRQCEAIGDKLLVFSQSLYSLDLIEHFLGRIDEATQEGKIDDKLGGHVGSWSPGVDYFRLDGSTSCENRSIWCKNFNREDNPRARLFLISTRAGGLGINLVAANRVVIFDVSWNPSHDVQSIFRVYRFGQKKPCYIYRFLAMGTMEEKIYERQVTKQAISKRVIDEQQIDRHYAENDLAELYNFSPRPPEPRPLPPLPKDRLFAEMLKEHDKQIYKYHEHDSLLENKEEETLTEEERKAAWEDFENEKTRPPPAPFPNWPMQGLLQQQQQQQQYAFTAIASMLRKEYPNLSEQQLAGMLPLIYSANPALMQKMNDIYKYANPGMMNPAAMMNPASMTASGGPLGGSSSLQYEPPWQRQQQQQQQLRLQQMMQQQHNMNAKYYAGGLGSRDPVAMAMQQQRARQMLVPDGRRPRGRPPLSARPPLAAPAPAPADVVDLDSD